MPQRPGAFAAQFAPETLQRFKDLCRQQDKAYSKVLERLVHKELAFFKSGLQAP